MQPPELPNRRLSLYGIASFIIALMNGAFGFYLYRSIFESKPPGAGEVAALSILACAAPIAALLSASGFLLASIAVRMKHKAYYLTRLGLILNGLGLAPILVLYILWQFEPVWHRH